MSDDSELKKRSFVSTMSLFFQGGYSAVLGLIANLVLTVLLSPRIFGIYITVLSIIAFLNYFSDIGLAASLIQKKDLSDEDVKTTFTVQQILIISIITIGVFSTSFIAKFYSLPKEGVYLYWSLLFGFFLSSLKTIPSVFLERRIKFEKIVFVQVVENTIFYVTVSIFALAGFALMSFTFAVLFRSISGLILIYSISFWKPSIGISRKSLKKLLSFGIPFQASSFLALFKDDLIILYLGKAIGFEALGYIGWAKKWADAPIRIVMDNVSRVLFPLIARFQDNRKKISRLCEKLLYYQTALLAPIYIGMILTVGKFIDIIPNYQKWEPALPIFYIFAVSSLIVSFGAPFMNLFNALGRVKISFSYMLLFTAITWLLTPTFTSLSKLYGFPITHLIISTLFIFVLIKAKRTISFNIIGSLRAAVLSTIVMGIAIYALDGLIFLPVHYLIFVQVLLGIILYGGSMIFVFRINPLTEIKSFYLDKNE